MRKLLLLLCLLPLGCFAQTGSKPDFIRTPNSNFTIVDWNFKAKTFNLPHYLLTAKRPSQDSIGTIFLNTNTADPHIYIKNLVGSTYVPLAYLSDIHANTFTNDFKLTGSLVGFADTLHRTNLPWTINNTSASNPALVVNSGGPLLQTWYAGGVLKAEISSGGLYRSAGIADLTTPNNSFVNTTTTGTRIFRSIADGNAALTIANTNSGANGVLFNIENYYRSFLFIDAFGSIQHSTIASANGGNAKAYWMLGELKPVSNGNKLIGLDVEPIFGTSTTTTYGSLTGGSGYPNGTEFANFTGGTGANLVAQVTVVGGVITSYTITDSGINYTVGDVVSFLIEDSSGTPVGTGGTLTITGVTNYTGVSSVSAWFKNAPIQLDPISTPSVLQTGMMWQDGSHLYAYINSAIRQLDQQIGVSSIFGRNGNVLAQSGDYNTSQVTESGNLYFTQARVLATPATGFSPSAGVISATDPLITVLNKLQGNITAATTGVSTWNGRTGAVTLTTADVNAVAPTTLGTVTAGAVPYTLLSGSVPTWNQNTTGSAAKLTTTRAINGVNFDGTAAITITANTPGTHTNGYGIVGSPFSGANQTWRIDTARGKLVTTYGLLDTINAHGATPGYGVNPTLFSAGTVAVDSTQVGSKAWAFSAFYTKAQSNSSFAEVATANTFIGVNKFSPSVTASAALAQGVILNPILTQAANNDAMVGLDIHSNSIFGAFTGAKNYAIRATGVGALGKVYGISLVDSVHTDGSIVIGSLLDAGGTFSEPGIWMGSTFTSTPSASNYIFNLDNGGRGAIINGPSTTNKVTLAINNVNKAWITTGGAWVLTPTPTAANATTTLTTTQLQSGVKTTSTTAVTFTLPTATALATAMGGIQGHSFEFVIDNSASTASGAITVTLGSGFTSGVTPGLSIPIGKVAIYQIYFTSTTTCVMSQVL